MTSKAKPRPFAAPDSDDEDAPMLVADDEASNDVSIHVASSSTPSSSSTTTVAPATSSSSSSLPSSTLLSQPYVRSPNAPPVPLTILTGWLGAGKTTLLTRILAHFTSRNERLAIIQNEASEFGVEIGLAVKDDTGVLSNVLELGNGCVCCSVKNDFLIGVESLLARSPFDYIVLECSGLADPGPLANLFWVDPELESSVTLDAIISVVDGKYFGSHLSSFIEQERQQVIHQVAYADRIILNKCDLITEEERKSCLDRIRNINTAKVYCTIKSNVDLNKILHIKAFDLNDTTRAVLPELESTAAASSSHSHSHSHISDSSHHPHDTSITTLMIDDCDVPSEKRRSIDLLRLKLWLSDLLWSDAVDKGNDEEDTTGAATHSSTAAVTSSATSAASSSPSTSSSSTHNSSSSSSSRPNEIFRLKAILAVAGEAKPTYLQCVQELYDLQTGEEWPEIKKGTTQHGQRFTRFVIIGRRLDQHALRTSFQALFV